MPNLRRIAWWSVLVFLLLGSLSDQSPASEEVEFKSDYTVVGKKRFLWMPPNNNSMTESWSLERQQYKLVLDDPLQTEENRYLASFMYVPFLLDDVRNAEAHAFCLKYPPRSDHFEYLANCIVAKNLPLMETVRLVEAIGDQAFQALPQRTTASTIYKFAAARVGFQGHVHESIRIFKKSFDSLPANAEAEIVDSKFSLASAYANPLLSVSLQRKSIEYYNELLEWYRNQEQNSYNLTQYRNISFNKAIGLLFMFKEYNEAILALTAAEGYPVLTVDIHVFKAYAYAQNHQKKAARAELKAVDFKGYVDPDRMAFLRCYMDLTQKILGDPVSMHSCLILKDSQIDVLLDLTSTLSNLALDPREENQMWRTFYRYFTEHLKPDFQESMATVMSEGELQQEKAEGRLKDLKLKNMSLYQDLSYALLGIAGFCSLALFLAIRSWRVSRRHASEMTAGKARLQYIMDSVEEGLIMVRPGLILEPEESRHLLAITGGHDLKQLTLDKLLELTNLSEDARSIALHCLEAVLEEGPLAWELNQPNLPTEAHIEDREIAFYWQPLFHEESLKSVLLVLRDITAINELQRKSKKASDEADRMLEYAREILSSHPRAVASFLGELPRMIQVLSESALQSEDYSSAKIVAHSIKGTARTLGLLDLQNQAHRVENALRDEFSQERTALIRGLTELAQTYTAAMQHVLGDISESEVQSLFELIAHHKPDLERQLAAVDLVLNNVRVDESITLSRMELQPVAEIVLHALTNAVDHGFILPKKRGRTVPEVCFAISVFQRGDHRVLILRDNGAGIDHQKILQQAKIKGWSPGEDQIWSDFLFLEGVTTTDLLTLTSGRGVGMTAIKNAAHQLHGHVQLLDNDEGPGSMLRIVWPVPRNLAA